MSILVRSWTGWRGKPHLTYLAFLEVDRANTPRLDIAALQAEGIELPDFHLIILSLTKNAVGVPKIRFCNIGGEVHRELAVT